mgnify:CR=1 FL=1
MIVPPLEALYQLIVVAEEEEADKPILASPQDAAGLGFIVGRVLTVIVTGLVTTQPFEEVASNVYVVVEDALVVGVNEPASSNPVDGVHA